MALILIADDSKKDNRWAVLVFAVLLVVTGALLAIGLANGDEIVG